MDTKAVHQTPITLRFRFETNKANAPGQTGYFVNISRRDTYGGQASARYVTYSKVGERRDGEREIDDFVTGMEPPAHWKQTGYSPRREYGHPNVHFDFRERSFRYVEHQ